MKILLVAMMMLSSFSSHAGPAVSGGSSPFAYSGAAIQTVFKTPHIWQKIFGTVEGIRTLSQDQRSVKFQFWTTEMVGVKNANGSTVAWNKQPCSFVVTVSNVAAPMAAPDLKVTELDFAKCPSVLK